MGNMLAHIYEFNFSYYVCTSIVRQLVFLASLWFHGVHFFSSKNMVAIFVDFLGKKSQETCRDMTKVDPPRDTMECIPNIKYFYVKLT